MNSHIWRTGNQTELAIVIHADVSGTNAVGVPFSVCLINSGLFTGRSVLPIGDGTNGTIDHAEAELIELGTRVEFMESFPIPTDWDTLNNTQKAGRVNLWRTAVLNDKSAELQRLLNYFGSAFN